MKVAAFQAPFLPFGSFDAIDQIRDRIAECDELGVDLLVCPESVIGGLALESDGHDPDQVALGVASGELADAVGSWRPVATTVVAGFTERDEQGQLFSAAVVIGPTGILAVTRKLFPGYRTVIQAGAELTVHDLAGATAAIIVCNDIWYVEPARVLAARGAALLVVPTNSGHVRDPGRAGPLRARGRSLPIARAVDTSMTVVVADVAGSQHGRSALGSSVIVDPDGAVLAEIDSDAVGLVVADVEPARRTPPDPRGWDGHTNPVVTAAFRSLWSDDAARSGAGSGSTTST